MTAPVRAAINRKASEEQIIKAAAKSGFTSLFDDARKKIKAGITTPEEVLRVIQLRDSDEYCCPRCSRPMSGATGICPFCNELNPSLCAGCGSEVSPRWQFCPRCGEPVHWGLAKGDRAPNPVQRGNWGRYPRKGIQ
jgi:hypothetical protein